MRRAISEGLVTRTELFIVSKLWNTFHEPARVEAAARASLAYWGLDYFDLYLVHFPLALKYVDPARKWPPDFEDETGQYADAAVPLQQTWQAMEALVDGGLARGIGVSNYNAGLLLDLLRYARTAPATLQIEHHPYLVQQRLVDWCASRGVAVTAYSSFGPQSFLELDWAAAKRAPPLLQHELVGRLAARHGRSAAQVLLRWATQRGVAVIPKTSSQQRLAQNLDVCSFDLAADELAAISALDQHLRFNDPSTVSY